MTRLPDQFVEDKALRDAARDVFMADVAHAKTSFSGKEVASRIGGRIGDGAKDVLEVAKVQADDNRGVLAILIGAVLVWLARQPITEVFGLSPFEDDVDVDNDVDGDAETEESDTEIEPLEDTPLSAGADDE